MPGVPASLESIEFAISPSSHPRPGATLRRAAHQGRAALRQHLTPQCMGLGEDLPLGLLHGPID